MTVSGTSILIFCSTVSVTLKLIFHIDQIDENLVHISLNVTLCEYVFLPSPTAD